MKKITIIERLHDISGEIWNNDDIYTPFANLARDKIRQAIDILRREDY